MALNIPNTGPAIDSLISGVNTGSSMFSRMMQPIIDRERLKQQQDQFVQNLALQKQAEGRQQTLLPLLIQQYNDAHAKAAAEAKIKELYQGVISDALSPNTGIGTPTQTVAPPVPQVGGQPNVVAPVGVPQNVAPPVPDGTGQPVNTPAPVSASGVVPQMTNDQEHELRAGNPRLAKLDQIAGLVPGIPKPVQHISNGMVFTTYPSGRMTVQQVSGQAGQTPGERNVSAKEASKLRDQATALINSANLVNQGYELLDNNEDLTGIGSGLASKFNLSNNPELGKFTSVTGKLQAELGKYAASRGGIQAVNWASGVKPSQWKPEEYNYGMFEGIEKNLKDDYATLNAQYRAATGQDLPVPLPTISRKERPGKGSTSKGSGDKKVKKVWKLVNGELV